MRSGCIDNRCVPYASLNFVGKIFVFLVGKKIRGVLSFVAVVGTIVVEYARH